MKRKILAGTTSLIDRVFIRDTSQTGYVKGLTGLTYSSAGLTLYYIRAGSSADAAVTLVTATVGTWASGGFKEIDSTNMPGWYEVGIPNAAVASGAASVGFHLRGATNMEDIPWQYELDAVNYQSANAFVTGVNSLAPPTNWNLEAIDGSGYLTLSATGWNGASLPTPITPPSNFATMAIDGSGRVVVGTNNDKTGYALGSSGLDAVQVESGINARQALSPILAAAAGVLSGAATTNVLIAAAGSPGTNRINATVDASGDRTAITLNLPT